MDTSSDKKVFSVKYVIAGIVLLLVGGVLGYLAGFNGARAIIESTNIGSVFKVPSDVRSIVGTVTEINGTQISFHSRSVSPFSDPSLVDRTITINASTVVSKMVQKDQKVFLAELNSYQKTVKAGANGAASSTSPFPYTSAPASAMDLHVGDLISVATVENIAAAKEFTASSIMLLPKSITP